MRNIYSNGRSGAYPAVKSFGLQGAVFDIFPATMLRPDAAGNPLAVKGHSA
jgi:hypothetical protein